MATNGIHRIEENSIDKVSIDKSSKEETRKSDSCDDGLLEIIDFYNQNVGMLTPYGMELFQDFLKEMNFDVIIYAMKLSVEADKRNIKYIKAILNNWSKAGIKNLNEAQKENQKFKENKQNAICEETEEEKKARKIKELEESIKNNGDKGIY